MMTVRGEKEYCIPYGYIQKIGRKKKSTEAWRVDSVICETEAYSLLCQSWVGQRSSSGRI